MRTDSDGNLRTLDQNRAVLELIFDPADSPPLGNRIMDLVEIPVRLGRFPIPSGLTREVFVAILHEAVVTCHVDVFTEMLAAKS